MKNSPVAIITIGMVTATLIFVLLFLSLFPSQAFANDWERDLEAEGYTLHYTYPYNLTTITPYSFHVGTPQTIKSAHRYENHIYFITDFRTWNGNNHIYIAEINDAWETLKGISPLMFNFQPDNGTMKMRILFPGYETIDDTDWISLPNKTTGGTNNHPNVYLQHYMDGNDIVFTADQEIIHTEDMTGLLHEDFERFSMTWIGSYRIAGEFWGTNEFEIPLPSNEAIDNIVISPQMPRDGMTLTEIPSTFSYHVYNWPENEGYLWWIKHYELYISLNNGQKKKVTKPLNGDIDGTYWGTSYHDETINWLHGNVVPGSNTIRWHVKRNDWNYEYTVKTINFDIGHEEWEDSGNTFKYTGAIKNAQSVTLDMVQANPFTYEQTGYDGIRMTINNHVIQPDKGDAATGSWSVYEGLKPQGEINHVRWWYSFESSWTPILNASIYFTIVSEEEYQNLYGGYYDEHGRWIDSTYPGIPGVPEDGSLIEWIKYIANSISENIRILGQSINILLEGTTGLFAIWSAFFSILPAQVGAIFVSGAVLVIILRVVGR